MRRKARKQSRVTASAKKGGTRSVQTEGFSAWGNGVMLSGSPRPSPDDPHSFSLCSASPPALPASSGSPRMTGSTPSELLDKETQALAAADPSTALLQFLPARLASMHRLPPPPRGSLSGLLDCAELPVDRGR